MFEDVITAENVEKLRNLGVYWKYNNSNPDNTKCDKFVNKQLWLNYNKHWYRYHNTNLGSLIFEFLYCNNSVSINETIDRLVKENKLEV